jgi:hypothetical protein
MPEWLQRWIPEGWSDRDLLIWATVVSVASAIISIAMVAVVVVRLPENYFVGEKPPAMFKDRHPLIRWPFVVLKNIFGIVLVGVGAIMSLPGVPGQGFLTILIGCMLLDLPGKRHLERFILRRHGVSMAINKMREKFGKPPLKLDSPTPST